MIIYLCIQIYLLRNGNKINVNFIRFIFYVINGDRMILVLNIYMYYIYYTHICRIRYKFPELEFVKMFRNKFIYISGDFYINHFKFGNSKIVTAYIGDFS